MTKNLIDALCFLIQSPAGVPVPEDGWRLIKYGRAAGALISADGWHLFVNKTTCRLYHRHDEDASDPMRLPPDWWARVLGVVEEACDRIT